MDQEQLIRQIMAEVMKNLGGDQVTFDKNPAGGAKASGAMGVANYPLAEKHADLVKTSSGKTLDELSFDKVKSGQLNAGDFRISAETLEMQAQIATDAGRETLARNLRRAAELIAVPDERLLEIYNALRPYRSTKEELYAIADELKNKFGAEVSAGFVREAADVYESRGRLRVD